MGNVMWLSWLTYISLFVFLSGSAARALRHHRQPIHLRWELHTSSSKEGKEGAGSCFQNQEWWTKPHKKHLADELGYMAGEIFLFREYYRKNRSLWCFTYSLHLGLYLGILWLLLITFGAVLTSAHPGGAAESAGTLTAGVCIAEVICGVLAFLLGAFGAIGLLVMRLRNEDMRLYSVPADYFNLLFLGALFLSGLAAWTWADPSFNLIQSHIAHLLLLSPGSQMHPLVVLFWTILCLFVLYMPFTPMMHFIGKYFMYHSVRWDNEPNVKDGKIEKRVQEMLRQHISWSGSHIKPGSTWLGSALDATGKDNKEDRSER